MLNRKVDWISGHGPVLMRDGPELLPYDPVLPQDFPDINDAEFVYTVFVGITSEEFGRISRSHGETWVPLGRGNSKSYRYYTHFIF